MKIGNNGNGIAPRIGSGPVRGTAGGSLRGRGPVGRNADRNPGETGIPGKPVRGSLPPDFPPEPVDNETTFNELLILLADLAGGGKKLGPRERGKRRPGAEQLRHQYRQIARIPVGEGSCEVYDCGFAVFDNGDRKTVLWVPDAPKAVWYPPLRLYEKRTGRTRGAEEEDPEEEHQYSPERDPGVDKMDGEKLGEMPWYLAIVLAGETWIEKNLNHGKTKAAAGDADRPRKGEERSAGRWRSGAYFPNPEEAYLLKEARLERRSGLTEKQWEVYEMYCEDGRTQEEIAALLGISQKAVSCRLEGIERRLKKLWR